MILNMINIEGPIGEEKDWIFYFTINDYNNNVIRSYEQGISFFELWKVLNENFQKETVFGLVNSAIQSGKFST
jgi:hypothetical protein